MVSNWDVVERYDSNNACRMCYNDAGDDRFGSDTTCCYDRGANNACRYKLERVEQYVVCCVATNDAGDDASGSDTTCDVTICA